MVSALRQRAATEAATTAVGGRVEPMLNPAGMDVPVVTDEVVIAAGPAWWRTLCAKVGAWPVWRRVSLRMLAVAMLGLGLTLVATGLTLYFWPSKAHPPAEAAAAAAPASAPVAETIPAAPEVAMPQPGAKPSIVPPLPRIMPGAAGHATQPPEQQPESQSPAQAEATGSIQAPPASTPTLEGHGAAPAEAAPASSATAATPSSLAQAELAGGDVYGVDADGDGVPEALDLWIGRAMRPKPAREAAHSYYQTMLPLATKVHAGVALSKTEKVAVLRAAECYLVTATEEGVRSPPNLNDKVLTQGGEAAARMKGLFRQLQGVDYPVTGQRKQACGEQPG